MKSIVAGFVVPILVAALLVWLNAKMGYPVR